MDGAQATVEQAAPARRWVRAVRPEVVRPFFSQPAWICYAACIAAAVAAMAARTELRPHARDVFFLSTPARSIVAVMVVSLVLAAGHEACHWLAARAEGVAALVRDPAPLLAHVRDRPDAALERAAAPPVRRAGRRDGVRRVILFLAVMARLGERLGWWSLPHVRYGLCAALAFVMVGRIVTQLWVFCAPPCTRY